MPNARVPIIPTVLGDPESGEALVFSVRAGDDGLERIKAGIKAVSISVHEDVDAVGHDFLGLDFDEVELFDPKALLLPPAELDTCDPDQFLTQLDAIFRSDNVDNKPKKKSDPPPLYPKRRTGL